MGQEPELKNTNSLQKEFQNLLDKDFKDRKLKENEIIKATVTEITKNFVVVDCKAKMEGMIPIEEFKNDEELAKLKVGSQIEVYLERIESFKGEIIISRDKARKMRAWKKMEKVFETQEEMTGYITGKVKGGFVTTVEGLPCFMPSSQIDVRPLKRIDHLMNTPVKVIATRIDKNRGNVCVSRRAVLEKSKNAEITEALKNIKEGDIIEDAIVKATTDWGIFLDIKGIDALLHVSDLSHGRVKKPSDLVTIGQKLKVKITKIDEKTNRVSASVKALTEDPYENIEKKYKVGEIYEGVVTKIMDYGCFIKIEDGIEGLIHNSELDWTNRNVRPSKVLSVSQKIKFKIVNIDKDTKRISLSYKATLENPWEKIREKVGQEVKIKINNISDKAIFGDLVDGGLSGMLHYKEISYDENIENLKKFKKNEILNVKIIEIKDDKIKFSKRALDKDPFDWFKDNNKKVGDIITTRIHEVLKTGVKVSIDKDKKLIVTIRKADLAKETADQRPEVFSKDNALDSKIIELDLKNRKIKLSVKAAQIDEEKSLIAKFGEGATKSGATLKGIFEKAIGKKGKKEK
ncbi:S1 RNA-binding domain-containing protein [Candidatus Pelagibacter bacterium]|jgi:small subunit ribosomal protein S1|nr:S1 RNA-binding domain-containing protein [Candidatus Pelagibacter bacterium]|tara:strand:+ start:585 stop:2306 length:1722 start_codon:yes stop_codon:yes gene_type:complete